MPKLEWKQLEELRHDLERIRTFHCENIMREKVLLDSIKETIDKFNLIIEKQED